MRAVLERDFLSQASRGRAFLFRTILGAAVVSAVAWVLHDRRELLQESPDVVGRAVFGFGGLALVAALALLTPPAIVGAILEERSRDTLNLVLAAPVSPRAFVSAKFAARAMTVILWAMAAVVPLFLTTLLGGVGWLQVGELLALGLGVVIELAAWGLWVSSMSHRLATAAVFAYLLPVVRWAATAGLLIASLAWPGPADSLVGDQAGRRISLAGSRLLQMAALTTPVPAALNMVDPANFEERARHFHGGGWGSSLSSEWRDISDNSPVYLGYSGSMRFNGVTVRFLSQNGPVGAFSNRPTTPPPLPSLYQRPAILYLLFSLVMAMAALVLAGRRMARESEPRGSGLLPFFRRRGLGKAPADGANPVAWKEQRLLNTASSRPLFYAVLAVLLAAEGVYLSAGWSWIEDHAWVYHRAGLALATVHVVLLALVAAVSGAASMAYERSTGTLALLRLTRLTPGDIVRGKQAGIVRGLGLVGLVPILHILLMLVAGSLDVVTAFVAVAFEVLVVLAWAGIGILCGMGARSMENALRRTVACLGVALLGVPLAAALLGRGPLQWGSVVITASLPEQFRLVLDASLHKCHAVWMYAHSPQMFWPEPSPEEWTAVGTTTALGLLVVAGLWFAPRLLARRFEREREEG